MTPYGSEEALESLRESKKRIENSLTPKARVFRRLKGGRPKKLGFDKPTPLQAVNTLFNEIERAHGVMLEEKLIEMKMRVSAKLTWQLFYYAHNLVQLPVTSPKGFEPSTRQAVELLTFFAAIDKPLFLRIQWSLIDAEEEADPVPDWFTYFNAYPLDTQGVRDALEAEGGSNR